MIDDMLDSRFYYEPMMSSHPLKNADIAIDFLGFNLKTPIWVSSMTGGTEIAKTINTNLAKACGEYGMGMGLGSCRALLESKDRFADFDVKKYMSDQPLYANLGIAQIEKLLSAGKLESISEMIKQLQADGLIIHVNPLQEWLQPEGDRFSAAPIITISKIIDALPSLKIIVKEVGQGIGPKSLKALYNLPIEAVDFAAGGGTNFASLELMRSTDKLKESNVSLSKVGHSAIEMVTMANDIFNKEDIICKQTIISGGIKNYLDGYHLTSILNGKAIYGQAYAFLKEAMGSYSDLQQHVEQQIKGLQMANSFLVPKGI